MIIKVIPNIREIYRMRRPWAETKKQKQRLHGHKVTIRGDISMGKDMRKY